LAAKRNHGVVPKLLIGKKVYKENNMVFDD